MGQLSITTINNTVKKSEQEKLTTKVILTKFIIQNNLPFSFAEELIKLFEELKHQNLLTKASNVKLTRKETAVIAKEGISKFLKKDLIIQMRQRPFSLILDEASDGFGKKFLLVLIRFLNIENLVFEEKVHSLIEMGNSSTGKTIYDALKQEVLNEEKICANFMGLCTDGASNMRSTGDNSLTSILTNEFPHIFSYHDVSHCLNLISKYSLCILPSNVKDFLLKSTQDFQDLQS